VGGCPVVFFLGFWSDIPPALGQSVSVQRKIERALAFHVMPTSPESYLAPALVECTPLESVPVELFICVLANSRGLKGRVLDWSPETYQSSPPVQNPLLDWTGLMD
jgi:hypothetical protein